MEKSLGVFLGEKTTAAFLNLQKYLLSVHICYVL